MDLIGFLTGFWMDFSPEQVPGETFPVRPMPRGTSRGGRDQRRGRQRVQGKYFSGKFTFKKVFKKTKTRFLCVML